MSFMLSVLFWVFCVFTTCSAFGMRSIDPLFIENFYKPFSLKAMSSPTSFFAFPIIWGSLSLGIYSMCSVHVECAEIETPGKKFATWHSDVHCNILGWESIRCLPWCARQNSLALQACLYPFFTLYPEVAGLEVHFYRNKSVCWIQD